MQRQLFFEGSERGLKWRETPLPALIQPSDVLVRPVVVARCDFDIPYISDRLGRLLVLGLKASLVDSAVVEHFGAEPFSPSFAVGHEFVAEVVDVGSDVSTLQIGDMVTSAFQISCGSCENCRDSLTSHCLAVPKTSLFGFGASGGDWGGAICERLRVPFGEHMLVRVPAGLSPSAVVAAGDNLCVAWQGTVPELKRRPGARVLVIGGGCPSIGLYAVGFAVHGGSSLVDYVDMDADGGARKRTEQALSLGARQARLFADFPTTPAYDLFIDASSSPLALSAGLRALRRGGHCSHLGVLFGASAQLPTFPMYMNGISIRMGWGDPRTDMPKTLDALTGGGFDPGLVHETPHAWEDAAEAWMEPNSKIVIQREPLFHRKPLFRGKEMEGYVDAK